MKVSSIYELQQSYFVFLFPKQDWYESKKIIDSVLKNRRLSLFERTDCVCDLLLDIHELMVEDDSTFRKAVNEALKIKSKFKLTEAMILREKSSPKYLEMRHLLEIRSRILHKELRENYDDDLIRWSNEIYEGFQKEVRRTFDRWIYQDDPYRRKGRLTNAEYRKRFNEGLQEARTRIFRRLHTLVGDEKDRFFDSLLANMDKIYPVSVKQVKEKKKQKSRKKEGEKVLDNINIYRTVNRLREPPKAREPFPLLV